MDVAVHHSMTMHAGGSLDIARASRLLLRRKIATSAAWPSDDRIQVPSDFRSLGRGLQAARRLHADAVRVRDHKTWAETLRFALRHPRFGYMQIRVVWAHKVLPDLNELIRENSGRALMRFLVKHPVFGMIFIVPRLRLAVSREPAKAGITSAAPFEPIRPNTDEDEFADAVQQLNEAESLILDQQLVAAAERASDAQLFGGRDRNEDRFVRLSLRSSYHQFTLPGFDEEFTVVFEPRLFIHESGVLQLSIRIGADGPLLTDQVLALMSGVEPRIISSKMPKPLLDGSGWENVVESWGDGLDAGKLLGSILHGDPVSMVEVLLAHFGAIQNCVGLALKDWRITRSRC